MNWQWKLKELMDAYGIDSHLILAERVRAQFPEVRGDFGNTTLRMILNNNVDRLKDKSLIALCRFFGLKSLSQLVDFDDAPKTSFEMWQRSPKMRLEFKVQTMLNEVEVPQKEFAKECMISVSTVNRFCRGLNGTISFNSLIQIAATLRRYTIDPNNPWSAKPASITDLLELDTSGMRKSHPALNRDKNEAYPEVRIHPYIEPELEAEEEASPIIISLKNNSPILTVAQKQALILPEITQPKEKAQTDNTAIDELTEAEEEKAQIEEASIDELIEVEEDATTPDPAKPIPSYRLPLATQKSKKAALAKEESRPEDLGPQKKTSTKKGKQHIIYQ